MTANLDSRSDADDDVGVDAAEDFINDHEWVLNVGRVGWVAKGVVYTLTGVLALSILTEPFDSGDSANGEASQSGAIATIARQPFGRVLLWAMAIGLFVYAIWRIITVILPADNDGEAWLKRGAYLLSAATYIGLGVTAILIATKPATSGQSQGGEESKVDAATREVMGWPGGRYLVGIVGLIVVGAGVYFLYKAVAATFEKQLEQRSVGPFSYDVIRVMGRAGWVGRGVMMVLIGLFVIRAAYRFDPDDARGLDDSLRGVADSSPGAVLVLVVAIGLIIYGVFCVISTPIRKLVATDDDTAAR